MEYCLVIVWSNGTVSVTRIKNWNAIIDGLLSVSFPEAIDRAKFFVKRLY